MWILADFAQEQGSNRMIVPFISVQSLRVLPCSALIHASRHRLPLASCPVCFRAFGRG